MAHESQQNKILYFIREYWVILAFVIGLVVTWTNFKANDASADVRLGKLEASAAQTASVNNQILVQLGQLQTDIQWIKLRLK